MGVAGILARLKASPKMLKSSLTMAAAALGTSGGTVSLPETLPRAGLGHGL